jgi:inorganic pyrophosphatase
MNSPDFWDTLSDLLKTHKLVIDRPRGQSHPRYPTLIYPFDYGYLGGTSASDGDGIDVWVGSLPEKALTGILCTFDTGKSDAEIKLLVGCSPPDIEIITGFNAQFMHYLFIPNPKKEKV